MNTSPITLATGQCDETTTIHVRRAGSEKSLCRRPITQPTPYVSVQLFLRSIDQCAKCRERLNGGHLRKAVESVRAG